jgi:hypothetical protein
MGFLLFVVSIILSIIMYPLALLTSVIINILHPRTALDKLNQQCIDIAVSIDVTGNVVCDDLMNQIWLKKGGYKFGNRKETISSVLGKNQLENKLTWLGWLIAKTLDTIEKDHCFNSIDENV